MNVTKLVISSLVLFLIMAFFVGGVYAFPVFTIDTEKPSYYLGEDIVISGINTVSDNVSLFIKGANMKQTYLFTVDVSENDTWTTTFDIEDYRSIDAGTYTISASSQPSDSHIFNADYPYATTSVTLKQPFLSATVESSPVVPGTGLKITGTAELPKENNGILYYIFGEGYFSTDFASVSGTSYMLNIDTTNLANGQYFVVVQHPMYDRLFNIGPVTSENGGYDIKISENWMGNYTSGDASLLFNIKMNDLRSANAADSLCQALDSQYIDDIYACVSFIVDSTQGNLLTISKVTRASTSIYDSFNMINFGNMLNISGANTKSDYVHIYMEFPNKTRKLVSSSPVSVIDNTWNTACTFFTYPETPDLGTYTLYAVAEGSNPPDPSSISEYLHDSWTIEIDLVMDKMPNTLTKDRAEFIIGNATGTTRLLYYIFGVNYFVTDMITVDGDGSYWVFLNTESMSNGQYFIVFQHPGGDGVFNVGPVPRGDGGYDIKMNAHGDYILGDTLTLSSTNYYRPSYIATLLSQALDQYNLDDDYVMHSFIVAQPTLTMNPVSDIVKGQSLTVSGTTNLKEGTKVTVDILSTAFAAVEKTRVSPASFRTQTTTVLKGADGVNLWEVTFDTTELNIDTYHIQVFTEELGCTQVFKVISAELPQVNSSSLPLTQGWNFISVPKTLNASNNTAGSLFGSVETNNKNILAYNAQTRTWAPILNQNEIIQPLNGYWIYSANQTTITLTYPSTPTTPSVKTLYPGWNAIGLSSAEPASARSALAGTSWRTLIPWNLADGSYDAAIVNGGSDANSPDRLMTPGNGCWVYVDTQSTMTGLTA